MTSRDPKGLGCATAPSREPYAKPTIAWEAHASKIVPTWSPPVPSGRERMTPATPLPAADHDADRARARVAAGRRRRGDRGFASAACAGTQSHRIADPLPPRAEHRRRDRGRGRPALRGRRAAGPHRRARVRGRARGTRVRLRRADGDSRQREPSGTRGPRCAASIRPPGADLRLFPTGAASSATTRGARSPRASSMPREWSGSWSRTCTHLGTLNVTVTGGGAG